MPSIPVVALVGIVTVVHAHIINIVKVNFRLFLAQQLLADAEVTQLGLSQFRVYENVIWLDVSVHLLPDRVKIVYSTQYLEHNPRYYKFRHARNEVLGRKLVEHANDCFHGATVHIFQD